MNDWKTSALQATERAKNLALVFNTDDQSFQLHNGPCHLRAVVLEPNEHFDEESLPVFIVETAHSQEVAAFQNELSCENTEEMASLLIAVSAPFSVARRLGDWTGPNHLIKEGSAEEIAQFNAMIRMRA